ncbi:SDR family oxidoreductase [Anaerobacillus sp. CMMVII]|uniref:SDR family NAD(P)-dependent oxidoreductase n=1 Tax=Anaerobacillus sp. CMMVII TaxID=2755588 RepID=UPI0021B7210B|nr:SDR family oxidoreductase [Anaerobacillus sp. CMMVII]MCT8138759.1 SDR family oxidoreductase [Anaerobacillus sp. CMMVII]
MKHTLHNKIIVITGASSGIGLRLAIDVAQKGGIPVLLARSTEKLQSASAEILKTTGIRAPYFTLDVSNHAMVSQTFHDILKNHQKIDVLINNAGFAIFDTFLDSKVADIEEMFAVNVFGVITCTKAVLPAMLKENQGHIINIASQAGKLATPKSSVYSATKHAVLAITNSLRMELINTNIFVSAVNPGPIKTPFFDRADSSGNYAKNVEKFMLEPSYVSEKILQLIDKPKREINLPGWMGLGTTIYQLFPSLVEKIAGKKLNQK